MTLEKAKLFEIIRWPEGEDPEVASKPRMTVQFNPASLKVSYSNQVQTNGGNNGSAIQSVGKGDSKLTVELIFDVSGAGAENSQDVRKITQEVAYFINAIPQTNDGGTSDQAAEPGSGSGGQSEEQQRYRVPGIRFQWGTFVFDGIVVSMDETLELWSEDGRPLRATVTINLSQPGIHFKFGQSPQATPPPKTGDGTGQAGTTPLTPATQGANLQGLVANAGIKADWKTVAAANGIENPRNIAPGTLLNLNVKAKTSVGASTSARVAVGGVRSNLSAGGGLNG
ncbi:MAG: peptidoglycan-binding protein [Nodosilinea sp.]